MPDLCADRRERRKELLRVLNNVQLKPLPAFECREWRDMHDERMRAHDRNRHVIGDELRRRARNLGLAVNIILALRMQMALAACTYVSPRCHLRHLLREHRAIAFEQMGFSKVVELSTKPMSQNWQDTHLALLGIR
jgi:hypothetical protein